MDFNVELPSVPDAEKKLIGLVLLEQFLPTEATVLTAEDFFSLHWRQAWTAIAELAKNGEVVEPLAVHKQLKELGSTLTVAELLNTTTGMVRMNAQSLVKHILDTSQRRRLIKELSQSVTQLTVGEVDVADIKARVASLKDTDFKSSFRSLGDILETEVRPALGELSKGVTHKISTGFTAIDDVIGGGLSPSDVLVVAAMTGAGKSAFALQLASNIAMQNIPVAFASGEMSDKENAMRLLSQCAKVFNLNTATRIYETEYDYLNRWLDHDQFKSLPLFFDSKTSDLRSLNRNLKYFVEAHGIKVLVIDYIQLFRLDRYDKVSRVERIAEASQEVKRMAMEHGISIVEVAQFNREGAKSGKPTMSDLEGSSQLEKDASLIFIIDRDPETDDIELRIVKGRNTAKSSIRGKFIGPYLLFNFDSPS